jgi:hypothetical protein
MNQNSKSTLAKLLARENITVQHGTYRTAFFDVENRVLGLPLWKDKGKDIQDLLIGHEVGHALYTPAEGWHDSKAEVQNIPKAFLNVVEDIRIEKLIQRTYPGLIASFKRGYSQLNSEDIFEIKGKDVQAMNFMNRLNLKSKLRDLIDISFYESEIPYYEMALSVETWDDTVRVSKALYEYMLSLQEKEDKQPNTFEESDSTQHDQETKTTDESSNDNGIENEIEEKATDNSSEDSNTTSDMESISKSKKQETIEDILNKLKEDKNEDPYSSMSNGQPDHQVSQPNSIDDIETDSSFHNNETKLLDTDEKGRLPCLIRGLNAAQLKDILVPFELLKAARQSRYERIQEIGRIDSYNVDAQYKTFIDENTKVVNLMCKEFEMRKAAYQYSRSQTSKSGSLDVTKLHGYKFNDDIFRKVTRLADAKSHGMIMLVDYSGSMHNVMPSVLKQILNLAMFCKKVNIPFDVYGFTNIDAGDRREKSYTNIIAGDLDHRSIVLTHQLSSSFSKHDYALAYRQMFNQCCETSHHSFGHGPSSCEYDQLGGTPLNEVLTVMPALVDQFRAKHNIQKVIMTTLTDGDAQHMYVKRDHHSYYDTNGMVVNLKNQMIKARSQREITDNLIDNLRKNHQCITLGYFLSGNSNAFRNAVSRASGNYDWEKLNAARKQANANKFVSYDNTIGYDRYFILKTERGYIDTDNEEFEVASNAKTSDIRRAFKKFACSKKTNRVLAAKFAEIVS